MDTRRILHYEEIDSTNRLAKELIVQNEPSGTVIRAEQQTVGRGQYDRCFSSPAGGLYFSLILRPELLPEEIAMVTLAAGLGCRDAVMHLCGLDIQLKWPNDLYCHGKKLAGILSEYVLPVSAKSGAIIVGAGLNVNSRCIDFPTDLQGILTTVRDETGQEHKMEQVFLDCVECIEARVAQLATGRTRLLADWQEADYLQGRRVGHFLKDELLCVGNGRGLDVCGRYKLQLDDGSFHTVLGGQLRAMENCQN